MTPMPPIHPAASIFPMIPERELAELAEDIRRNGQRDPIILWHGQLLDGRNRWMACGRAGVEPRVEKRDDLADPIAFVISVNIHRRHLDESQRAMAAARLRTVFEPEAHERMALGGRATAGNAEALASLQTAEPMRPDDEAGRLLNVSPRSIRSAKLVLATGIPELQGQVDAGMVAVSTAADVARLPAPQQEEIVARGPKQILEVAKQLRRERTTKLRTERTEALATIAQGNRPLEMGPLKFPVIYADPSWLYDAGTTDPTRRVDQKYPPMPLEEIKALPVGELATDAAVLFLWAVNPLLPEAIEVGRAWGFTYKTNWSWDKEIAGMGVWGFGQHELLLIFTRGDMPTPPENTRPPSVLRQRRQGEHSEKPAEAAARIERMFPTLPRIELFAREVRPGWHAWGNEAKGGITAPEEPSSQLPLFADAQPDGDGKGPSVAAPPPAEADAGHAGATPATSTATATTAATVDLGDGDELLEETSTATASARGDFPKADNFEEIGAPPDAERCPDVCNDANSLADGERCMLRLHHRRLCMAGGVQWRGRHVHPDACLDCAAAPGEQHAESCDDWPAICGQPGTGLDPFEASRDWRAGAFSKGGELVAAAHGCTKQGATDKADGWQKLKKAKQKITRIEIANPDGVVVERRELVGKTWAVRREEPRPAVDGPVVCRTPTADEQEEMHRECPEIVRRLRPPGAVHAWCLMCSATWCVDHVHIEAMKKARCPGDPAGGGHAMQYHTVHGCKTCDTPTWNAPAWVPPPAPPPLPADHPARKSKVANSLIKHIGGATGARNFDSAREACDELEGLDALPVEVRRDAAARLRAIIEHAAAQPDADEEPAPRPRPPAPKRKRTPKAPPDPDPITIRDAKLIKAITLTYSGDKSDEIRKPVELDEALWVNMGAVSIAGGQCVMLWRVVPIEEWSGAKATHDSAELLARWESGATWRGDRTGYQAKQGAQFYVFTGQRRAYRWGGKGA